MTVLLHFVIKNSKLVCKMSRDSVPKNNNSIANRVFKELRVKTRDDYNLLLLLRYAVQGSFVKYERVAGASPINTLWSNLINQSL